ncbi:MAG: hypothetical protein JWP16_600 [Alphaproteobacteria bacterium]|nr:hypothetical protein [Alphaproteobacteria bacterium]
MSLQKVHLRKLLQLFDASEAKRKALLRADIRAEIRSEEGGSGSGNDFYVPFWSDAKNHVTGQLDLTKQTEIRIVSNDSRKRLYPDLRDGFLSWWNDERRRINEPFGTVPENISTQFPVPELGTVVKVENVLAFLVDGHSHRIVYPYFSEVPKLTAESARLGLWLLSEALNAYVDKDLRILDVIRSDHFSLRDFPLQGNEKVQFLGKYKNLLAERERLKREY